MNTHLTFDLHIEGVIHLEQSFQVPIYNLDAVRAGTRIDLNRNRVFALTKSNIVKYNIESNLIKLKLTRTWQEGS